MKYQWKLAKHLTLFEKYFKLDEYSLSHELFAGGFSPVFTREIFERGSVVVDLGKAERGDGGEAILELRRGLSGKADDDVCRDGDLR